MFYSANNVNVTFNHRDQKLDSTLHCKQFLSVIETFNVHTMMLPLPQIKHTVVSCYISNRLVFLYTATNVQINWWIITGSFKLLQSII